MDSRRLTSFAFLFAALLAEPLPAQAPKATRATTAAEAAKVLDLSTLPLMDEAAEPGRRTLAGLTYVAAGDVGKAVDFHRDWLLERGFKELPGTFTSAESSSAAFEKGGYRVSLSVFSPGTAGAVTVSLIQHGDVALDALPAPAGAKPFYSGPANAMFLTEAAPDAARAECRKLLLAKGWEPYGDAGDVLFFRRNAVRLTAMISAAPAQGNKTMVMYSSELLSVELPAPPDAERAQYSDEPPQLSFDVPGSMAELTAFYRKALAPAGWKATTEKPVKIDLYDVVIFRNPAKDMLTLRMHDFEGKTRGLLEFDSAADVAEVERLAEKEMKDRPKDELVAEEPAALVVEIPSGATKVQVASDRITFRVANGKAKGAVERLAATLKEQGWEGDAAALEDLAGAVSLSKEKGSATIHYTDTGFLPAEVTIDATGVELKRAE